MNVGRFLNRGEPVQACLFCKGGGSGAYDVDCPAHKMLAEGIAAYGSVLGWGSPPTGGGNVVPPTSGDGSVDETPSGEPVEGARGR